MLHFRSFVLPLIFGAGAIACFAQPNRIPARLDTNRRVILPGRVHPLANAAHDAGDADGRLPLFLTLELKPSADQQAALDRLILQQQSPTPANIHKWLTPEQYADRFGVSPADTAQITAWLQAQGFTVEEVARSRTFVTFSGTSGQVRKAFGAAIHRYTVNGVSHYANATDPQIPEALSGLVAGIRGLHDFHPHAQLRTRPRPQLSSGPGQHELAPSDFATIYNINPMYSAGINGAGQSIAVVGQSALYNAGSDITQFWKTFGITGAKLTQKLVSAKSNPGVVPNDVDEASLDVEWASAVARNATIVFVYSNDAWTSAEYAVDHNVAPVLSMSFGTCELSDLVDLPTFRQLVQQANAQGITWVAAAGDQGAADCDYGASVAEGGLAVDTPGSIPEVTAMGGTTLNDSGGSYWNSNGAALGYIPEVTWNETAIAGYLLSTGGGVSTYFPQPSWQTLGGVPQDGWRHVPDISFSSALYRNPYYVWSEGGPEDVGGTSAATPTMAGVVALLNQYAVQNGLQSQPGLGNINPTLYRLAQSDIFHDVSSGDNKVPCAYGSPQCDNGAQGFGAGTAYDSVTGLGSMDVTKLIQQWSSQSASASLVVAAIDQNPVYQTLSSPTGNQWSFNLTLTEEAGIATTLTDFTINGVSHASQIASLFGGAAIGARQTIAASYTLTLNSVPANETFGFSGMDSNGTPWSTALTVPFQGTQTPLRVAGVSNAATGQQVFAPGMILSVYGTGLGVLAQAAATIPLPEFMAGIEAFVNNVPTPLYYVGPNQVNLQVPYETSTGAADLTIYGPYQIFDYTFNVSAAGPGIFTFADGFVNPSRSARVGDILPMFITGDGKVSPPLADGATPSPGTPLASLPKPRQAVSVTVGGIPCPQPLNFVGIPSGLVGVTQINFTIPAGVASGKQPVVVTVGATQTPAAYITIQ